MNDNPDNFAPEGITVNPCPFCNWDDVEIDEIDLHIYAVCCPECGTIGPIDRFSPERAIQKWNQRVTA